MNLGHIDVATLLPHEAPMVLLDAALEANDTQAKARVKISSDSVFAENGRVGAWVGIEYMAQTIGVHAGYLAIAGGVPVRIGYLLGTQHYRCSLPYFEAGMTLTVVAEKIYEMPTEGLGSYACSIRLGEKEVASATCTVYQPQKP